MTQSSTYIRYVNADPASFKDAFFQGVPDAAGAKPGTKLPNGRRHRLRPNVEAIANCEVAFTMSETEPERSPSGSWLVQTVSVATWLEVTAGKLATMQVWASPASPAGPTTVSVLSVNHGMVARFDVDAEGRSAPSTATWPASPADDRLIIVDSRNIWAPLFLDVRIAPAPTEGSPSHMASDPVPPRVQEAITELSRKVDGLVQPVAQMVTTASGGD